MAFTKKITNDDCILFEVLPSENTKKNPKSRIRPQMAIVKWCRTNVNRADWSYTRPYLNKTTTKRPSIIATTTSFLQYEVIYFAFMQEEDAVMFKLAFSDLFKIRQVNDNIFRPEEHKI